MDREDLISYYQRMFPGFWNRQCYEILADWEEGVPDETKKESEDKDVFMSDAQSKIRNTETESLLAQQKSEDGFCS